MSEVLLVPLAEGGGPNSLGNTGIVGKGKRLPIIGGSVPENFSQAHPFGRRGDIPASGDGGVGIENQSLPKQINDNFYPGRDYPVVDAAYYHDGTKTGVVASQAYSLGNEDDPHDLGTYLIVQGVSHDPLTISNSPGNDRYALDDDAERIRVLKVRLDLNLEDPTDRHPSIVFIKDDMEVLIDGVIPLSNQFATQDLTNPTRV